MPRGPLRGSPGENTQIRFHRRGVPAALHAEPTTPDEPVGGPLSPHDLARAILAGEWSPDPMVARCEAVTGRGHRRWLRGLVGRILEALPRPDHLDADLVTAWLVHDPDFLPTFRTTLRPKRARRIFLPLEDMVSPRIPTDGPLAALPDAAALARWLGWTDDQLLGHADLADRHAWEPAFRDYRYAWHGSRLVEAPKDRLRRGQRRILRGILERVPPHPAAHGFVPGRSPRTHALLHAGKAAVLRIDLRCFFGSIPRARVRGLYRSMGYPPRVARLLAALCTTVTPADVARGWPWRRPHLPQGAPSSPWLANLVAWRLDARLTGLATRWGDLTYSRYADDLTFSGDDCGPRLVARVGEIVGDEGFVVNEAKTRIAGRGTSQRVTGLVVNQGVSVPRRERDALRATLHACRVWGPSTRTDPRVPDLEAHLRGRVAWVCGVDPKHGARLRAMLDDIDWSR